MTLNINVNDTYKLTSDSLNVIINRKHIVDPTKAPNWAKLQAEGKSGELREEWREVAYCRTVEKALNFIAEQEQRESNAESISELLSEIKAFQRQVSAVLAK